MFRQTNLGQICIFFLLFSAGKSSANELEELIKIILKIPRIFDTVLQVFLYSVVHVPKCGHKDINLVDIRTAKNAVFLLMSMCTLHLYLSVFIVHNFLKLEK